MRRLGLTHDVLVYGPPELELYLLLGVVAIRLEFPPQVDVPKNFSQCYKSHFEFVRIFLKREAEFNLTLGWLDRCLAEF